MGRAPARVSAPDALWRALLAAPGPVLLTGPVQPDGDSIGACLGLQRVLSARGAEVEVAGTPPERYAWMPGADRMVPDASIQPRYAAVVVLDGDRHRLTPPVLTAFQAAPVKGLIDHHASTRDDGYTAAWIAPQAESTCGMLYGALQDWGVELDPELATCLYVGLIFDTGGFRYSNTTAATHQMAAHLLATGIPHARICERVLMERRPQALRLAGRVFTAATFHLDGQLVIGRVPLALRSELGLRAGDLEGVVDALVHLQGVEVAALLVEEHKAVKYSLRSRGQVDVAELAQTLAPTGGGHAKAAGARVLIDLDAAAEALLQPVRRRLAAAPIRAPRPRG